MDRVLSSILCVKFYYIHYWVNEKENVKKNLAIVMLFVEKMIGYMR